MNRYQMLIGGEWVDAAGGLTFETNNPLLGAPWALVPRGSPEDDRAVAAGVWTQSIGSAFTMSPRLEAGTDWINAYRATSYLSPFGGYKRSGIGRESGLTAIREYLQEKSVWIDTVGEVANPFVQR